MPGPHPTPAPRLTLTVLEDRSVPANTDLSVAFDPNPPVVYTPGLPVHYTVTVAAAFSSGQFVLGTTTGARFTEDLIDPATGLSSQATNLRWTATYANGASGPAGGTGPIDADTLVLPPGSSATFDLTADTPSSATEDIEAKAEIQPGPQDSEVNPQDNGPVTATAFASPVVDLRVQYSPPAPATYAPGAPVTYTVVATNAGPSDAPIAGFTETLTGPVSNVRWTATYAGGASGPTAGTGDIDLTDQLFFPAGGSITFVMTADTPPGETAAVITDTADVFPQLGEGFFPPDSDTENNSVTATTAASPLADLRVTAASNPAAYIPGGTVTYTVVAVNAGPSDVPAARVTGTLAGPVASANWTAAYAGGAAGPAAGAGGIAADVVLPAGGSVTFTVTATTPPDATAAVALTATVAATAPAPSPEPIPPVPDPDPANNTATATTPRLVLAVPPVFAVGGDGTPGVGDSLETVVGVYDGGGNLVRAMDPLGLVHGVHPATAPVTTGGSVEVTVGTGRGDPARLVAVDTAAGQVLRSATPFADFTGGLSVAVGSLDGTASQYVVAGADDGGGPVVVVYLSTGDTFTEVARFLAFDDPAFRGGVRVAVGPLGDGYDDLAVAAGPGGGPRVQVYDGLALAQGRLVVKADFLAAEDTFRGGGYVAIGDLYGAGCGSGSGSGSGNIIFGAGGGGGPRVAVFDGHTYAPVASFYTREEEFTGGVRVAARDLDQAPDGRATLITGDGPGASPADFAHPSQVRLYEAPADGAPLPAVPDVTLTPFPDFTGGLSVG